MVIGVIFAAAIISKIADKTIGGEKKMSIKLVKTVMRLVMARMNMIRSDIKILQIRKQRAMQAIRAMESARSKLPTGLRKVVSMEISNIKSNVSAVESLQNSLRRELKFLQSRVKTLKKIMRQRK